MDFLEGLNPQQREAVAYAGGPLLILAGAGSGKTRVITHRIAHLIHEHRVPPGAIVAVTFTNKAADEMRERVGRLLGGSYSLAGLVVSTFHSFCVRLLRRDGQLLADLRPGFTRSFTIYDEDDQLSLVKAVYRNLGLDEKQFLQCRAALSRISHAKNHKQTPEEFAQAAKDPKSKQLAVVFEEYEGRLRQANALDFDDLLLESVRLLRHDEATRRAYNRRIQHLLIDEYQDTNRSQYELMRLLTETHQNVCVVGDEDQSIYSWRGADIHNILDFERDYPEARTIRLEQNYRSTKNILESASAMVAHNLQRKGKWLWTAASAGRRIGVYQAPDAENEALFIADTIERLLSMNPNDRVAILYRTNFRITDSSSGDINLNQNATWTAIPSSIATVQSGLVTGSNDSSGAVTALSQYGYRPYVTFPCGVPSNCAAFPQQYVGAGAGALVQRPTDSYITGDVSSFQMDSTTSPGCPSGQKGFYRRVTKIATGPTTGDITVGGSTISETLTLTAKNDLNLGQPQPFQPVTTVAGGYFDDQFGFCSSLCPGSGGETDLTQVLSYQVAGGSSFTLSAHTLQCKCSWNTDNGQ